MKKLLFLLLFTSILIPAESQVITKHGTLNLSTIDSTITITGNVDPYLTKRTEFYNYQWTWEIDFTNTTTNTVTIMPGCVTYYGINSSNHKDLLTSAVTLDKTVASMTVNSQEITTRHIQPDGDTSYVLIFHINNATCSYPDLTYENISDTGNSTYKIKVIK